MSMIDLYKSKRVQMDEIVREVKSGDKIFLHPGGAIPQDMERAFAEYAYELHDVTVFHIITLGPLNYIKPELKDHVHHVAWFSGSNTRAAINDGRADWVPIFLHDVARLLTSGKIQFDVAMLQVSPPDEHGFCSLGIDVGLAISAVRVAKKIIVEVNPRMPRTLGNTFVHLSKIHKLVEVDHELAELPRAEITEDAMAVAKNVASIIDDGDCLQMGIGGIPDATLLQLADRRDLGIHTEMFSDSAIDLLISGVLNGERKSIHRGKLIAAFILGSKRTYEFMHNNPLVEFHSQEYCNDPFVIAQNDNMVAINSCIQIDLTGQVVSDNMGRTLYSGFGGQVDFIRGAARSKNGRPIIAFISHAKAGTISKIVAEHPAGYGITTSRADVHWVATEYGIVNLWAMSRRERALALIELAHPNFRESLQEEAIRLGLF
jgi:4-hydroxybutyrate CoA-transferase